MNDTLFTVITAHIAAYIVIGIWYIWTERRLKQKASKKTQTKQLIAHEQIANVGIVEYLKAEKEKEFTTNNAPLKNHSID
jgi:hypothetical protein